MANRNNARRSKTERRVLTLDPKIRRVAAAYIEGALLVDWVIASTRKDPPSVRVRSQIIPTMIRMLDRYCPTVLILPDVGPRGVRRSANIRIALEAIRQESLKRGINVVSILPDTVKNLFDRVRPGAGRSKPTMHRLIVEWFPELAPSQPKNRKPWESERHFTPLFDAIGRWIAWQGVPRKTTGRWPGEGPVDRRRRRADEPATG